jgi:hypothetical protein
LGKTKKGGFVKTKKGGFVKTNHDDPIEWRNYVSSVTGRDGTIYEGKNPDLTKREHFASLAMQGLLAAVYSSKEMLNEFTQEKYVPEKKFGSYITGCEAVSKNAVNYADALIAELNKEKREG